MKSGPLQKKVTFERRSSKLTSFGEAKDVWRPIAETWASIEPLSGREFFAALQTQSDVSVRIVCRYTQAVSTVKAQDRIVHKNTVYDIRHPPIDKDMRNREMQFMCTVHTE
jgi:SPP1 family predicted phage head-tail adaptor